MLKVQYWSGKIINEGKKIVKPRLFSASSFKRLVLLKKLLWTPCGPKQFCQKPFSSFCLLQWWLLRAVCLITEHCHLHGLTLTNQQKKKVGCNSPFFFTLIIKFKKRLGRDNSVLWTYYERIINCKFHLFKTLWIISFSIREYFYFALIFFEVIRKCECEYEFSGY